MIYLLKTTEQIFWRKNYIFFELCAISLAPKNTSTFSPAAVIPAFSVHKSSKTSFQLEDIGRKNQKLT